MGLDTYFDYNPVCHIFKWGGGVVTFKPDKKVEKLIGICIKDDRTYYRGPYGRSADHYIKSCIDGLLNMDLWTGISFFLSQLTSFPFSGILTSY